jgi:CheY-like chemotaxis protein
VVLLDYQMPRFSGAQTLQYIRQLSPNTRVIGLTGIEPTQLPPAFHGGVDGFIRKPFHNADLLDAITNMTANSLTVTPLQPSGLQN